MCNSWFTNLLEWTNHCQSHLDGKLQLPTQCNPFAYDKCIASLPFCLGDKRKDAAARMRHLIEPRDWRDHVNKHIEILHEQVATYTGPYQLRLSCYHPRQQCGEEEFNSVQSLAFHLQDVYCWMVGTRRTRQSNTTRGPSASDGADEDEYKEKEEEEVEEDSDESDAGDELLAYLAEHDIIRPPSSLSSTPSSDSPASLSCASPTSCYTSSLSSHSSPSPS